MAHRAPRSATTLSPAAPVRRFHLVADGVCERHLGNLGWEVRALGRPIAGFPHPDGIWPDSQEYIQKELGHLPAATRHKIVCENAAKLYRFVN